MKKLSFTPPMAEANLLGLKTVTRRLIPQPELLYGEEGGSCLVWPDPKSPGEYLLTVDRNTIMLIEEPDENIPKKARKALFRGLNVGDLVYMAEGRTNDAGRKVAAMYASEKSARLCLRVTALRIEKMGTLPFMGWRNEGIAILPYYAEMKADAYSDAKIYSVLWDSINDHPATAFDQQPWVLVVCYEVAGRKEPGTLEWEWVAQAEDSRHITNPARLKPGAPTQPQP
jgi:hypothetical protein